MFSTIWSDEGSHGPKLSLIKGYHITLYRSELLASSSWIFVFGTGGCREVQHAGSLKSTHSVSFTLGQSPGRDTL